MTFYGRLDSINDEVILADGGSFCALCVSTVSRQQRSSRARSGRIGRRGTCRYRMPQSAMLSVCDEK
jgi:hypothetical protein